MSKAFDRVNIHPLINKIHNTSIPPTIQKFIANYLKGRKAFTSYNQFTSKQQTIKTGVPQGGVLSPTLFNIYTSDILTPPPNVQLETYAYDISTISSSQHIKTAQNRIQPYLNDIFTWTKQNDLQLNPDKSTSTLFTPDPAEYNTTLNLTINNTLIPAIRNPKILGLTLDTKLNFKEHTKLTKAKADKSINILKTLTFSKWGKQKETILATYKSLTRPIIEYASTIWSPIVKPTNIAKLQTTRNTALRIATGCTADTNTDHIHQETKFFHYHNISSYTHHNSDRKQNYHHTLKIHSYIKPNHLDGINQPYSSTTMTIK